MESSLLKSLFDQLDHNQLSPHEAFCLGLCLSSDCSSTDQARKVVESIVALRDGPTSLHEGVLKILKSERGELDEATLKRQKLDQKAYFRRINPDNSQSDWSQRTPVAA